MVFRVIYRTVRSLLFSVTLFVVGIFVLLYVLLSIPAFTNLAKDRACQEFSKLLGGKVEIDRLSIYPFNEVRIEGIHVYDPQGMECMEVESIGGGIRLWKLITEGNIEITYGEIIGLHADIIQKEKGGPLNISFIIDAFKNKDNSKEKKAFELALKNVVLRKSGIKFTRLWMEKTKIGDLDLSNLEVYDLASDIAFPKISDKEVKVDVRRLSLKIKDALNIQTLALKGEFSNERLRVDNFLLLFPNSRIFIPEISLEPAAGEDFAEALKTGQHTLEITDSYLTPSDFSSLFSPLASFCEALPLELNAKGNVSDIEIVKFMFGNPEVLKLDLSGGASGLLNLKEARAHVADLRLDINSNVVERLETELHNLPENMRTTVSKIGDISFEANIDADMASKFANGNFDLTCDLVKMSFEGGIKQLPGNILAGQGELNLKDLRIQSIDPKIPVDKVNLDLIAEGTLTGKEPEGMISLYVESFEYKGVPYDGFSLNLNKEDGNLDGDMFFHNAIADIEAKFIGNLSDEWKNGSLDMEIERLDLSEIIDMKKYKDYVIAGDIHLDGQGSGLNDLTGVLSLSKFSFASPFKEKSLKLKELLVEASVADSIRTIDLQSDWVNARAEGPFRLKDIPSQLGRLAQSVFPALVNIPENDMPGFVSDMDLDIVVRHNNSWLDFFDLPVRLLVPVNISGMISGSDNRATLSVDIPYLQQGKDKLIYDTKLVASIDGDSGVLDALVQTTLPVKHGDLALNLNLFGYHDNVSSDIRFINTENTDFKGHIRLETELSKNPLTQKPNVNLTILPSEMQMGPTDWHLSRSDITYSGERISVEGLRIWHDKQFVEIDGVASPAYDDVVRVRLADIDVDYVFDMLQINYVTFGGTATGEVAGHALLSGDPVAETESFQIDDLTYNGALIGDCIVSSRWNNDEKAIEIDADIFKNGHRRVLGNGGIWLTRDSLSFNLIADKVPVEFVQPFLAVFSSHVGGFATGDVKLFGNFHDIDMTGKIFADSVSVKLDYTNTVYHGSDSIFLNPGKIEIPNFRLYDKNGNSALLTGELSHRYFHDPSFTFRLSDASNFLCYDTSAELNPDWYGMLYGTGGALLQGVPGLVDISADMTLGGNSAFTFVLNETQYANDYKFLTFSDRRGEELRLQQKKELTVEDYKAMVKRKIAEETSLSKFGIDIRATVTPQVLFTLVMDPIAGDKITARGRGAMQVKYESDDDEMMMYGKYEIEEGNYNFSLQDIFLRDFKIKPGSYIAFNGNPLAADLDISATYRVNTNLTDLDKSFSTDRDLNRTNVPVDAVLSVEGYMQHPDITFDIELPTLTQDVERKVKSIISTDDMMNRQIIYLLALNRFYTPEYMGSSGNGGELAAVASSTISSQLSNILGQLTDKFSISPSFRSDKGDFSDIEVDVALSSRLLNNRLLINGNFGYRDRSNSSTTFVGDFDVEYLLSKNGGLRLKAYNHFNDQNYYLREALTTQGLGLVYRKDFDNWFTFLKKRKKKKDSSKQEGDENAQTTIKDGTED